jgi:limonene-1,2-epoxide hydrolase
MARGSLATLAVLFLAALPACGGGDDDGSEPSQGSAGGEATQVAGDGDPADVKVIDAWSDALRAGDIDAAVEYFAIPSVAENGPLLHLRNRDDVRVFNESLPCGAVLVRAESEGDFTTATFKLTERPGPGICGLGTGGRAQTAFVIEDGKITEWRRVATGGPPQAPGETV